MKAIMVMFDTLNRKFLPNYGNSEVIAPNFKRLAEKAVTFDTCYAGSIPCMPARRELHTGRYNFLHRDWGPLEPFDDSMPELLSQAGVYTHLTSDHAHYWEDGGSTYHTRYSSWEFSRGQQGDHWKGSVAEPEIPEVSKIPMKPDGKSVAGVWRYDWVNRSYFNKKEDYPIHQTFTSGLEFIEKNHGADNWFLQIETFDPHEPFIVSDEYLSLYEDTYTGKHYDWPRGKCTDSPEENEHIRNLYRAKVTMSDDNLGRVMDHMDRYDLWDDTMLIVNTDHGFLLGEHGFYGKNGTHMYEEVSHTPLFIWDPRSGKSGERRGSLVQTIDLAPTLLEYFGQAIPQDMQGVPLRETIEDDTKVRDYGLFGFYGESINITDGKHVYMHTPKTADNSPLYRYTLVPMNIFSRFTTKTLSAAVLENPNWSFLKDCPVLKVPGNARNAPERLTDELYDVSIDPDQCVPIYDEQKMESMRMSLKELMVASDAPTDQFLRYGL